MLLEAACETKRGSQPCLLEDTLLPAGVTLASPTQCGTALLYQPRHCPSGGDPAPDSPGGGSLEVWNALSGAHRRVAWLCPVEGGDEDVVLCAVSPCAGVVVTCTAMGQLAVFTLPGEDPARGQVDTDSKGQARTSADTVARTDTETLTLPLTLALALAPTLALTLTRALIRAECPCQLSPPSGTRMNAAGPVSCLSIAAYPGGFRPCPHGSHRSSILPRWLSSILCIAP